MRKLINALKSYSTTEWLVFGVIASFISWWPFWNYCMQIGYSLLLILFLYFVQKKRFHPRNVGMSLFLILYFFVFQLFSEIHFSSLVIPLAFLLSSCLTEKESNHVVQLVTSYIALSVVISLPFWLIHQYVYEFQPFQTMDLSSMKGNDDAPYLNYFFFIAVDGVDALRFYSLYDEPGVLGTVSAFILWANGYNLKDKRCLIILIGAIFTFSLAFYVLTIFGWLASAKFKLSKVVIVLFTLSSLGVGLVYLLKDNLAFQQSIVYRFTNFGENGVSSRNADDINRMWDSFINSSNIIFGLGSGSTAGFAVSSYKIFLLNYGIFGLVILLIAYIKNMISINYYSLMTLVLFSLSFLQRPDLFNPENILLCYCIVGAHEYTSKQSIECIKQIV